MIARCSHSFRRGRGVRNGALSTGQIRIADGRVVSGFFAGWLTPFAFACGLFALALFAFLAATYLTVDPSTEKHVQNDFRLRAVCSGAALVPIAFIVFVTSKHGAPEMYHGLTQWWAPLLIGATLVCAIAAQVCGGAIRCDRRSDVDAYRLEVGAISKADYARHHYF